MSRLSGILVLLILLVVIGAATLDEWQLPVLSWAAGILAMAWLNTDAERG
jgi:hypothetical protein